VHHDGANASRRQIQPVRQLHNHDPERVCERDGIGQRRHGRDARVVHGPGKLGGCFDIEIERGDGVNEGLTVLLAGHQLARLPARQGLTFHSDAHRQLHLRQARRQPGFANRFMQRERHADPLVSSIRARTPDLEKEGEEKEGEEKEGDAFRNFGNRVQP
jgi:hypothetical protein